MKIYNLKYQNKGLFEYMDNIKKLPFDVTPEVLDLTYYNMLGERSVSNIVLRHIEDDKVTDETMVILANMILTLYFDKWVELVNLYNHEINLLDYDLEETETITDVGKNDSDVDNIIDTVNKNSVTGYNSEMFEDDNKEEHNTSNKTLSKGTNENERVRTKTIKGNTSNKANIKFESLQNLKQGYLYDTILSDITMVVGSLVY